MNRFNSSIVLIIAFFAIMIFVDKSHLKDATDKRLQGAPVDNYSIVEESKSVWSDSLEMNIEKNRPNLNELQDYRIERVRLYEKEAGITKRNSLSYSTVFKKNNARYICWEIIISHDKIDEVKNLDLEYSFIGPKDNILGESIDDSFAKPDWPGSRHTACWGWPWPGNWENGNYRVAISHQNEEIATANFEVQ